MILGNIVIIAFKFDELICLLLDTVQIEVAVCIRAVLDDHLTVCAEFIVSGQEVGSCKKISGQIGRLICSKNMRIANIVISAFKMNQLICLLTHTVKQEIGRPIIKSYNT